MPLGTKVGLDASDIVLDGDPAPFPKKRAETPNFRPMSIVAKRLHASRCHLVMEVGLGPCHVVLDEDPAPPPKTGKLRPNFRPMFVVAKRLD